jgi:N-acetylmuramoyl-L-alanine amidase
MFQDNKEDVEFLLSEKGKQTITEVHVEGILTYLKTLGK